MKVLTYLNSLSMGGIEVTLLRVLPHLKKKGVSVDIALTDPGGVLEEQFLQVGSRLLYSPNPRKFLQTIRTTAHRAKSYDIIHSRYGYSGAPHVIGAKLANKKAVVSFHNQKPGTQSLGAPQKTLASAWMGLNSKTIKRYADAVVGHSCSNLDALDADWRRHSKFSVILNGVEFSDRCAPKDDARRMLGLPLDANVVLHVGSFRNQKNHIGLLAIFKLFAERHPNSLLLLAGMGELFQKIKDLTWDMGIADKVLFLGHRRDVDKLLAASDVFLFPSKWEGYGNVLIEAQGAGVPVVASDISAHREAVAECQHRFLFSIDDYETAAGLLERQIDLAAKRNNPWVEEARKTVRSRNSTREMAERLADLYERLLS